MPLPTAIKTVTIVGEFVAPNGTPQTGEISLHLLTDFSVPAADTVVVRRRIKAVIGTDGKFSVSGVAVNTDPDASVSTQYRITARFDNGVPAIEKVIQIASNTPDTIQYEDLVDVPVSPPPSGSNTWATIQYVDSLIGAVAGGSGALPGYTHYQTVPGSVWVVNHNLGWNPAGIHVFNEGGEEIDGGVISYTVAGQQLTIAFDISFAGTARLT